MLNLNTPLPSGIAAVAHDWIRMRVWIRRDPKVIRMANVLLGHGPFVAWVGAQLGHNTTVTGGATGDVTRALCVTGLLEVWGTAREQGNRFGDDLVVDHCNMKTLDDITGIPGFGESMHAVGWAVEDQDGALVFPKFFTDKELPESKHKTGAAARQARYRQKKKDQAASLVTSPVAPPVTVSDVTPTVTCSATVAPRGEKQKSNTEEEKHPPTPHGGVNAGYPTKPADGLETDPGPEKRPEKPAPKPQQARPGPIVDPDGQVESVPEFGQLVALWAEHKLPGHDAAGGIRHTAARKGLWQQRLSDPWWKENWRAGVERLGKSFKAKGMGDFPRGVRMEEFLRNADYLTRILEGEFDDPVSVPSKPSGNGKPAATSTIDKLLALEAEKAKHAGGAG